MSVPSYVHENVEDLQRLVIRFRNQPPEKRLTMLLLLKSDPFYPFNALAQEIGCSPRSISRWWKTYLSEGLDGLLAGSRPDGSSSSFPHSKQTPDSSSALRHPDLSEQERAWSIQNLLVNVLHQFPVDQNIGTWCQEVRDVLQSAFDDVDRVTISVNTNCDLLHPEEYHPRLSIAQDAYPDDAHKGLGIVRHDINKADVAEELVREFERQGYPVDRYHTPFVLNLEYRGAYLGTVFLWREKSNPSISTETVETFFHLEQFLIYVMSDVILRHHYNAPVERVFYATLREVSAHASLTPQEHRVITYRLLGYMYKEIASELNISQDGVKKTLQQVYRKTETGSHIEFFAKYFAPRIVPPRSVEANGAL